MSAAPKPAVVNAIIRGALGEAVLIAAGVALYFITGEIWPIIGGALVGSALMLMLMLQAGAFARRND